MFRIYLIIFFLIINFGILFFLYSEIQNTNQFQIETNNKLLNLENNFKIFKDESKNITPEPSTFLRSLRSALSGKLISNKTLNSKHNFENNYNFNKIKKYLLPFTNYRLAGNHPTSYFTRMGSKILVASGSGEFFYINVDNLYKQENEILLNYVEDNISFYEAGYNGDRNFGIKDITLIDDFIYISHTKNNENKNSLGTKDLFGCYNTSISRAKVIIKNDNYEFLQKQYKGLNLDYLEFKEFFTYEDCVDNYEIIPVIKGFYPLASGGRIIESFNNNKILFSTGTFLRAGLAQDENNLFGKILEIDISSKEYKIISKGHRNPQGLKYIESQNLLLMSEHGPKGGDEININYLDKIEDKNYGWPISSYGEHYDGKFREEAPLNKSHKEYGFIEPMKYFVPSIGPSDFTIIDIENDLFNRGDILMGSLSGESIYHIRFNSTYENLDFINRIHIGEGIRDMEFYSDLGLIILTLENSPAIASIFLDDITYVD